MSSPQTVLTIEIAVDLISSSPLLGAFLERIIFQAMSNDVFVVFYNKTDNIGSSLCFILFWSSFQKCKGLLINVG